MKLLLLPVLLVAFSVDSSPQSSHFLSITKLVERINGKHRSWEASEGFLSSLSWTQIKMMANDTKPTPIKELQKLRNSLGSSPVELQKKKIPTKFDARKKWGKKCPTIGEVLDQGACASGWALAPAAAFSDRYCIATKGKHKARLSGAHILYCEDYVSHKCGSGGFDWSAWSHIVDHGIPTGGIFGSGEGCEPYNIPPSSSDRNESVPTNSTDCQKQCTNKNYKKSLKDDLKYAEYYSMYFGEGDDDKVQREILEHGPLTADVTIYTDFMKYKSGVYDASTESNNTRIGEHTVKIIGWGVEKKEPYWLVQNSWSKKFGQDGLIKIRRGTRILKYFASGSPKVPYSLRL